MYNIKVQATFSAAHNLRGYKGKCEELHGHNWKIEAIASKENLDKAGMVMDFRYLKTELKKIMEKLDHKYLNKLAYFSAAGGSASGGKKNNPTSENIAKFIYDRLKNKISGVKSVTVWENDTSSATYEE